jgi:hypothetical protein
VRGAHRLAREPETNRHSLAAFRATFTADLSALLRTALTLSCISKQNRPTEVSLSERVIFFGPDHVDHSCFLPDFFAAAQRFRIASAIRLRAAADIVRFLGALDTGVELFLLPGGRPRRFTTAPPPTPSKACIAASSLLRSSLSCCTISVTFIELFYQSG